MKNFFRNARLGSFGYRKIFRAIFSRLSIILILVFWSCDDDRIQLPNKRLGGTIDGVAWMYETANAYSLLGGQQYSIRFISKEETIRDPCTLPNPVRIHAKAIFEPFIGSYIVFSKAIDRDHIQVVLQASPSKAITVTSGFMEIYDISNGIILGYLQAELDDDNGIEGSFQIQICN